MDEKIKILLAEDDTNLGMLLKEYLRAKGFETVLCEDGEIAYERFLNEPFDICIFDVMMPKMVLRLRKKLDRSIAKFRLFS